LFGLDPDSIVSRSGHSTGSLHLPSRLESLLVGGLGFCLASCFVFATVALGERWLYARLGVGGTYLLWTCLFIMSAGAALSRLIIGPGRLFRFYALFTLAFLLYAGGWTAAYFLLKGRWREWLGAVGGSIFMGLFLCAGFSALRSWWRVIPVLTIGNTVGYFLGRIVWISVGGKAGMIEWGIIYGLGFGLGLGYSMYVCQQPAREQLEKQT
jgi:hypothetical protein